MLISFTFIATCSYCFCPLCIAIKLNINISKLAYSTAAVGASRSMEWLFTEIQLKATRRNIAIPAYLSSFVAYFIWLTGTVPG